MKILVFLLLSAIFTSETFLGVDSSDGSESSGDFSKYFSDAESSQPAESSTGRSRKGKKPVEGLIFKSHGESSSGKALHTEVPVGETTAAKKAQMDMKKLYKKLNSLQHELEYYRYTEKYPNKVGDLKPIITKTEDDIVELRQKLREDFGLKTKYMRIMPKITEKIKYIQWQLRENERNLNNTDELNDREKYLELYNERKAIEQRLNSLYEKERRCQRKIECWLKPEKMIENLLPHGMKYV